MFDINVLPFFEQKHPPVDLALLVVLQVPIGQLQQMNLQMVAQHDPMFPVHNLKRQMRGMTAGKHTLIQQPDRNHRLQACKCLPFPDQIVVNRAPGVQHSGG